MVRRGHAGPAALLALAASFTTGCLGGTLLPSSRGTTRVDSIPSGATVIVMGQVVGTTPVEVPDRLIFPTDFLSSQAELYGRIVLERTGCERAVRSIDLEAANAGIDVELVCESASPPATTPAAPATAPAHEG
jgi:hypothetical protein